MMTTQKYFKIVKNDQLVVAYVDADDAAEKLQELHVKYSARSLRKMKLDNEEKIFKVNDDEITVTKL